jgi:hypothetical protein
MEHYELSRKTKARKGEQMKRLALLSVVSLMLASAVFAPVAMAQEVGEVDVQSVRLGPGGSVIVTGTLQCYQDASYQLFIDVKQRSGRGYTETTLFQSGTCNAFPPPQPIAFTLSGFAQKPFHGGKVAVRASSALDNFQTIGPIETFRLH